MERFEYEVADYLLENGTPLKEQIEHLAEAFYEMRPYFDGDFEQVFDEKYQDFFCVLLIEELIHSFPEINYPDMRSIVTPELLIALHGDDYFTYD